MPHPFHHCLGVALVCLLAGCSLLNKPDRNRYLTDAGLDGGPDASDVPIVDGGVDAFDGGTDAGPELCDEVGDEDGNGLRDCSDFACAGHPICCMGGGPPVPIDFSQGFPTWETQGDIDLTAGRIEFRGDDNSIYVNTDCAPLARGAEFVLDFHRELGTTDCGDEGGVCSDYAAFFLSTVTEAAPGSRINAELAVTVYASGLVELRQGRDNVFASMNITLGGRNKMTLRVAPGGGENANALSASVVFNAGGEEDVVVATDIIIRQRDLIAECQGGISGLYFGVEGHGSVLGPEDEGAGIQTLECTNPTQFTDPTRNPVVADTEGGTNPASLDWTEDWSAGDIVHPELARDDDDNWHIFASTADQQIENATTQPDFPWMLGHSVTGAVWNREWSPSVDEFHRIAGSQPTVTRVPGDWLHYAVHDGELVKCNRGASCTPLGADDCATPSNPSIASDPTGAAHLLFYQCADSETEIRRRLLTSVGNLTRGIEPLTVITSGDLGPAARDAIVDFDILLDARGEEENEEILVRAWIVGEALGGTRTLLLATGALKKVGDGIDLSGPLTLQPYPGNPVATAMTLFGQSGQTLQGVSVERESADMDRQLLFLFGRRTERVEGRIYDFVPISQTWGAL